MNEIEKFYILDQKQSEIKLNLLGFKLFNLIGFEKNKSNFNLNPLFRPLKNYLTYFKNSNNQGYFLR